MKALGSAREVWTLVLTLGLVVASCTTQGRGWPLGDTAPAAPTQVRVQAAYGQLPLSFEANAGQTDEQVQFLSRGSGYTLFLTPSEAVLALTETRGHGDAETRGNRNSGLATRNSQPETVVRMQLVGANPNPRVVGLEELPGKSNYFIGNDPSKWRTAIPHYAKVKYEGLYPGIDLIYYGNQQQLEYDFVVAPGADPKAIQLAFDGLVGAIHELPLRIDDNGDLILHTASGELRLHKPRIYQEINGVRQEISGGYVLLGLSTLDSRLTR